MTLPSQSDSGCAVYYVTFDGEVSGWALVVARDDDEAERLAVPPGAEALAIMRADPRGLGPQALRREWRHPDGTRVMTGRIA